MTTESDVACVGEGHRTTLAALFSSYHLELVVLAAGAPIPGSYWGAPEAGLVRNRVYVRDDTPVHSAMHEACHAICMGEVRRAALATDAGGDYDEENAVCYLQIVLADALPGVGRERMMVDMDAWGYTFRLGSARAWFDRDAGDARAWLTGRGLLPPAIIGAPSPLERERMKPSTVRLAELSSLALLLAVPLATVAWAQGTAPAAVHATGATAAKSAPSAAEPAEMHAFGAWARATPPGASMSAAYVSFHNPQTVADRLLGASTPVAKRVELHETRTADGVARMRRVEHLEIAADAAVKFAPGGLHLMLLELTGPLKPGQKIPLQLRFANAGIVEVEADVRAPGAAEPDEGHGHH